MFNNLTKKGFILTFAFLLSILSVGITAAYVIPSTNDLLLNAMTTAESITNGHAIIEANLDTPEQSLQTRFEIWGQLNAGPNGEPAMRLEILDASQPELVGLVAVTDGTQFWLYSPQENQLIVGSAAELEPILTEKMTAYAEANPEAIAEYNQEHQQKFENIDIDPENIPQTPQEMLDEILTYFNAERRWTNRLAAADAYEIRLVPIPEKMPDEIRLAGGFLTLWLRESDQLPLGLEYSQSSLGYAKIQATNATINTRLAPDTFTFDAPAGTDIINAADIIAAWEPPTMPTTSTADLPTITATTIPNGALADPAQTIRGTNVQRFTAKNGSFYLAYGFNLPIDVPAEATNSQEITLSQHTATLHTNTDASRTLLTWQDGDLTFIIGGDITPADAQTMALSLK
ncbi:MAG TPA: hypothetical protein VLL52_15260 [Anaerolineae bacterium]|nr:hypothetical protein [Anaerolineae bacterium]